MFAWVYSDGFVLLEFSRSDTSQGYEYKNTILLNVFDAELSDPFIQNIMNKTDVDTPSFTYLRKVVTSMALARRDVDFIKPNNLNELKGIFENSSGIFNKNFANFYDM